jgi:hypothetical protein
MSVCNADTEINSDAEKIGYMMKRAVYSIDTGALIYWVLVITMGY